MIIFHGWKETNLCVKLNQSRKLLIPSVWSNQSGKTDNSLMFSLWRGTRSLQLPHDHHILPSHHRHTSPVPPLHYQGGPGVRESRHLQTGPASVRRSPGAGSLLCHPLCGCLREDRSENINLWDPPPRGNITKFVTKPSLTSLHSLQILTKDSVTVFVNAIMYYKVRDPTCAVTNVDDYSGSARLLAATTLR